MENKYAKIQRFFTACDELITGSFMVADTKIAEVLKSVAASKELTDLFSAATSAFDYPAAKRAYLRYPAFRGASHGIAYFPTERKDILAFVFCLLVDIDAGAYKLDEFLLRYFYVDGSYTASFTVFADRMLRPFLDIAKACFPDSGKAGEIARIDEKRGGIFAALAEKITSERARIAGIALREEERSAAAIMFAELTAAVGRQDSEELLALLAGYHYFLLYINAEDDSSLAIFTLAGELE